MANPKKIGRYAVVDKLGQGGMGTVYKAQDPDLDRFVAVKTIKLEGSSDEKQKELRERFTREARAAGKLSHPNIVTIFGIVESGGHHFIAGAPTGETGIRSTRRFSESCS